MSTVDSDIGLYVPDAHAQTAALLEECRGEMRQALAMSGFNLILTPKDRPDLFELWWKVREILQSAQESAAS